jgi:hypothetical protein
MSQAEKAPSRCRVRLIAMVLNKRYVRARYPAVGECHATSALQRGGQPRWLYR